jgi:hypothetical protein
MSWEEAMKEHAGVASRDHVTTDSNVLRSPTSASWDPHEVWLTRVKQPRERAARRDTSGAESQVRRLPD